MDCKLQHVYSRWAAYGPKFKPCAQCMADLTIFRENVQTSSKVFVEWTRSRSRSLCMNILMTDSLRPYGNMSPASYEGSYMLRFNKESDN